MIEKIPNGLCNTATVVMNKNASNAPAHQSILCTRPLAMRNANTAHPAYTTKSPYFTSIQLSKPAFLDMLSSANPLSNSKPSTTMGRCLAQNSWTVGKALITQIPRTKNKAKLTATARIWTYLRNRKLFKLGRGLPGNRAHGASQLKVNHTGILATAAPCASR